MEWNTDIRNIPKDIEFIGITEHGIVRNVHYACDLSCECQPPFEGVFYKSLSEYYAIKIVGWITMPNKIKT